MRQALTEHQLYAMLPPVSGTMAQDKQGFLAPRFQRVVIMSRNLRYLQYMKEILDVSRFLTNTAHDYLRVYYGNGRIPRLKALHPQYAYTGQDNLYLAHQHYEGAVNELRVKLAQLPIYAPEDVLQVELLSDTIYRCAEKAMLLEEQLRSGRIMGAHHILNSKAHTLKGEKGRRQG